MSDARVVLVTASGREEAERIAHTLVEERLAACVNIIAGIHSIYRWQDAVESAGEALLLIKTTLPRITALEARIRELHSYAVPEFLALDVESGSAAYLAWLAANAG